MSKKNPKPTTASKKIGRPSKYTKALADEICEMITLGSSIRTVCKPEHMPSIQTFYRWIREHQEFREQYARATEERTEAMSEDILDIADNGTNDYMETEDGRFVYNGDAIQRSRLRVDTRKWLMSKMKPKKYGDHLDIDQKSEITHKYEDMTDEQLESALKARKDRLSENA